MNHLLKYNHNDQTVVMENELLQFELGVQDVLTEQKWLNKLTGESLELHHSSMNPVFQIELDDSEARIFAKGWKYVQTDESHVSPNVERGYNQHYQSAQYDDSAWSNIENISVIHSRFGGSYYPDHYYWCRTSIFVEESLKGSQGAAIVLGGMGLYDFEYIRVFVNGYEVGTRVIDSLWNHHATMKLDSLIENNLLHFGENNVVAFQLKGKICRNDKLNQLDPDAGHWFPFARHFGTVFDCYLVFGRDLYIPKFHISKVHVEQHEEQQTLVTRIELQSHHDEMTLAFHYTLQAHSPVVSKSWELTNGRNKIRMMQIYHGQYILNAEVTDGFHCWFPVYINKSFFIGLQHPAGWVKGQAGTVELAQYPGEWVQPFATFRPMSTVFGVSDRGKIERAFTDYIYNACRRVKRGHDRPYSIYSAFGGWDNTDTPHPFKYDETEEIVMEAFGKLQKLYEQTGMKFDIYNIDFWNEHKGDLKEFHPDHFKRGAKTVTDQIQRMDVSVGLWIDSSFAEWSIGEHPLAEPSAHYSREYPLRENVALCWSTPLIYDTYVQAFRHHIQHHGVKLIKFDNFCSCCFNTDHDHLPGIYSKELLCNRFAEFLQELDQVDPDVFLMLYWGYRSPWWLIVADTLFEPGIFMEAASPSPSPTLFLRDGITLTLDQAQWWCQEYLPFIGKDSLGVWFSTWRWSSQVGAERWQEAFIMDICRGSLLAQPWGDQLTLNLQQRIEMMEFIQLLKEAADCFKNPQFIIGNPWNQECYGYRCSDGERSFLAINNCEWHSTQVSLEDIELFDPAWGESYQVFRWYPDPCQVVGDNGREIYDRQRPCELMLKPFEIALFEVVPIPSVPAFNKRYHKKIQSDLEVEEIQLQVQESGSQHLSVPIERAENETFLQQFLHNQGMKIAAEWDAQSSLDLSVAGVALNKKTFVLRGEWPKNLSRGLLVLSVEILREGYKNLRESMAMTMALDFQTTSSVTSIEPCLREQSYPSSWQLYRITLEDMKLGQPFEALLTVLDESGTTYEFKSLILYENV